MSINRHRGAHRPAYFSEVNLLDLQIVEHIGHRLQGDQLSSAHVLLTLKPAHLDNHMSNEESRTYLDVEVNDLQETVGLA
jgi:hypothetical protein